MFALNEKVVYPGHGVAQITRVIEKKIGSTTVHLCELKFLNKDMTILVPIDNFVSVGIRPLSSHENIDEVFELLATSIDKIPSEPTASNWNKRNKEYQCKIRTGNIREIGEIYRDLKYIAAYKELSFGEKNLLQQTEALLVEEIALVTQVGQEKAVEHLRSLFRNLKGEAMLSAMREHQPNIQMI